MLPRASAGAPPQSPGFIPQIECKGTVAVGAFGPQCRNVPRRALRGLMSAIHCLQLAFERCCGVLSATAARPGVPPGSGLELFGVRNPCFARKAKQPRDTSKTVS